MFAVFKLSCSSSIIPVFFYPTVMMLFALTGLPAFGFIALSLADLMSCRLLVLLTVSLIVLLFACLCYG